MGKDPFIAVSKMTGGCSSGTSSSTPRYTTDSTTSTASRCFGATAAELRSYASIFFLFGALFSVFPAGVMYFLFKKANGNGNNNRGRNTPGVAHVQNPHMQQQQFGQQQQQFGQQQQQFQPQQPGGFVQAQPVQAQPVQAVVYQPQSVQPAVVQPMAVPTASGPSAGGAGWASK